MSIEELLMREGVRKTLSLYSHAVDRGDFNRLISAFAVDARLEAPGTSARHGHAQILGFMAELAARFKARIADTGQAFYLRHHLTTSTIDRQADNSVRSSTRFLALGPNGVDHTGSYSDQLIQVDGQDDGGWLLSQRRIVIDWYAADSPIPAIMNLG
jgi:hypothetical protein